MPPDSYDHRSVTSTAFGKSRGREEHAFLRVADDLSATYGAPGYNPLPLNNKRDPLDELIYIMLTVMTEFGVDRVFARLKSRYSPWDQLATAREPSIARVLQPIGLSTQRARRLQALVREIIAREGRADLSRLSSMADGEAEAYLSSLPGVGIKIARCVMLYSLGREVFPVDAHVLRVLKRLRLAEEALTLARAQDALQSRVPHLLRYTLHVNLVVHGRTTCKARRPLCDECCLRGICPSRLPPSPQIPPPAGTR